MKLTPKQVTVLDLLCEGRLYKEIADVMKISVSGVRVHVYALMRKFEVSNPTKLVVSFVRLKTRPKRRVN